MTDAIVEMRAAQTQGSTLRELLIEWMGWASLGALIGYLAWGSGRTPLLAIMVPVLTFAATRRSSVALFAMGYHMALVHFLPQYVETFLESRALGFAVWVGIGWACALAWSICWTSSQKTWRIVLSSVSSFVFTLLPPCAVFLPGHPLVAWGYVLEGAGWFGLAAALVLTAQASVIVRQRLHHTNASRALTQAGLVLVGVVLCGLSFMQPTRDGRVAEDFVAFSTAWGRPPTTDEQVIQRIEKTALMAREISKGPEPVRLVVFPETAIGHYDPTFGSVMRLELQHQAESGGQGIIVGAEIDVMGQSAQNLALLVRRDGTISYVKQRQPAPISMWAPWRKVGHFPADWMGNNILAIEPGVNARVMFCFEEYIPMLHLINEARDKHSLVISMANAWAAPTLEATDIQARHTEGMARLFGRKFLRAENYTSAMAAERRARNN